MRMLIALLVFCTTAPASANELPKYAYDALVEISVAALAGDICQGVSTDRDGTQIAVERIYEQLVFEGYVYTDVQFHLRSPSALVRVQNGVHDVFREANNALLEREPFCSAVRSNTLPGVNLSQLVSVR